MSETTAYRLDEQIGFLLRRAHQRHTAIFSERMPGRLTPTQFSALARLLEMGPMSQNLLGRQIALDAATIKGVVDRLSARDLVTTAPDARDPRRLTVSLTDEGERFIRSCLPTARSVSDETLGPLDDQQRQALLASLARLAAGED